MQFKFDNRKVDAAMKATPELSVAVRSGLIQTALLCHPGDASHSKTTAQEDTFHTDTSSAGVIASCDASTDAHARIDSTPALQAVADSGTLPLYRRLGRRALRLLHPITLPFIRRIRDLAQEGVDASATSQRLVELAAQCSPLQKIPEHIETVLAEVRAEAAVRAEILHRITAQQNQLQQVAEQSEVALVKMRAEASVRLVAQHDRLRSLAEQIETSLAEIRTDVSVKMTAQQDQLQQVAEQIETGLAEIRTDVSVKMTAQQDQLQQVAEQIETGLAEIRTDVSMKMTAQQDQLQQVADRIEIISDRMNSGILGITEIGENTTYLASTAASSANKLLQSRAVPIGSEVLTRTPFGWLLVPSEDMRLVAALIETGGSLEPGTASVLQAILEPGDLAVDVGGHVGTLALAMARAVGPAGRIVVLEPTPRNAELLRRTAIMTSLENVIQVEQMAAGAKEGRSTLFLGITSGHNSLLPIGETPDSIEVDVKPLDALLPPDARPALVKIDAEGAELDIWQGMTRLITNTPELAVVVEFGPSHLARQGISINDWITALTEPGFTAWEIEEATGGLRPLRSSGLDETFSLNLLLLRAAPSRWPRLRLADS